MNHIIHLDGIQAKSPKMEEYNNGNVPYELHFRKNTIVSTLGKLKPTQNVPTVTPELIELHDIFNTSMDCIMLRGYIKTNFAEMRKANNNIGCGSITDGKYKLEVHITDFNYNAYKNLKLSKGNEIKVIGSIYNAADPPYLVVNNVNDIEKLDGHLALSLLLKGTNTPIKRKLEEKPMHTLKKKLEEKEN